MKNRVKMGAAAALTVALLGLGLLGQANGFKIDLGGGDFVVVSLDDADAGFLETKGPNGNENMTVSSLRSDGIPFPNHGFLGVKDPDGEERFKAFVDTSDNGILELEDSAGSVFAEIAAFPDDRAGYMVTRGPNGNNNAAFTTTIGNSNHGYVGVYDETGSTALAGIFVDGSGDGIVFGDSKRFVEDYPGRPDLQIVYVSLEGSEAGMYHRGRAQLVNGRALIELPEHFTVLAAMEGATVNMTPHSATSQGLAVAAIEDGVVEVVELNGGNGSYEISFIVHAERARFSDHQPVVVNPASRSGSADARSAADGSPQDTARSIGPRPNSAGR